MTRSRLVTLAVGLLVVAAMGGCASSGSAFSAQTPCSQYIQASQNDRQQGAARVSVDRHTGDAGNPMTYLNADQYCAQHPGATLGDAVGTSLSQYREQQAQQSAAASAAAAPTKTTTNSTGRYSFEITHLCLGQQSTANIVVRTAILTKSSMSIRGATSPVTVPPGDPKSTTEQEDNRMISVRCPKPGQPTKLVFVDHDFMSHVSLTLPESAGEMLTMDTTSGNYAILPFDNEEDSSSGISTVTIKS